MSQQQQIQNLYYANTLMEAAETGSIESIKILVKYGSDNSARDQEQHTVLSFIVDTTIMHKGRELKYLENVMYLE